MLLFFCSASIENIQGEKITYFKYIWWKTLVTVKIPKWKLNKQKLWFLALKKQPGIQKFQSRQARWSQLEIEVPKCNCPIEKFEEKYHKRITKKLDFGHKSRPTSHINSQTKTKTKHNKIVRRRRLCLPKIVYLTNGQEKVPQSLSVGRRGKKIPAIICRNIQEYSLKRQIQINILPACWLRQFLKRRAKS